MKPPKNKDKWSWNEIYPPLRFKSLLAAVKKVGFLPLNSKHSDIRDYIEKLCDHLGWCSPTSYVHPFTDCENTFSFDQIYSNRRTKAALPKEKQKADFKLKDLRPFDYYHYLLWVQYKMWEERHSNLPFFVNQAEYRFECSFEELGFVNSMDLNWMKPPFIWSPDNTYGFTTDFENFNAWLLISSSFHYFLYDLVAGTGQFDTSAYPLGMKTEDIFGHIRKSIERIFRIKLEKEILRSEYPTG